jgi:hypothetical protein
VPLSHELSPSVCRPPSASAPSDLTLQRSNRLVIVILHSTFHFIVKHSAPEADEHFLDVFNGGARLTSQQVEAIVLENGATRLMDEHVKPATKRDIIIRMLRNLLRARPEHDAKSGLGYLDVIVALAQDSALDRIERARLRLAAGDTTGAREDWRGFWTMSPRGWIWMRCGSFTDRCKVGRASCLPIRPANDRSCVGTPMQQ